jgi:hypothetical protein
VYYFPSATEYFHKTLLKDLMDCKQFIKTNVSHTDNNVVGVGNTMHPGVIDLDCDAVSCINTNASKGRVAPIFRVEIRSAHVR